MKRRSTRRLSVEVLENRRVLAAAIDLASITGRVFDDFSGNGFDSGEEIANAMLELYQDDGDGIFEPGAGDTTLRMTMSGADGRYQFARLPAGGYFVLQPMQTGPSLMIRRSVSPLITIDSDAVKGRIVTPIDTFNMTTQSVRDEVNDSIPVTSTIAAPEAIGGERDLLVNKTSVNGAVQLSINDPLLPNQLSFDSISTGAGERRITWDGFDGDATTVADTGLAGVNLTTNAEGLQLQIRADLAGGNARIRIYSDDGVAATASRFSTATIAIPATNGSFLSAEFIPFSNFVATSGGGADFTNIGAIELEITGAADVNGAAELVGAVGNTLFVQDFDNFESADLSLAKTVDNATPSVNQEVTFTIVVNNAGPDAAAGVVVTDILPSGIQFVRSSPSQGSYDSGTGLWDVGSILLAGSATLTITGTVTSIGAKTNSAEITSASQLDIDSTPGNDDPTEDDQAAVTVTPQTIDLSLAKQVDNAAPNVGQTVNFTVTVSNAGPDTATGVSIRDALPSGLTLVSATPNRGNFNTTTGIWTIPTIASGENVSLLITATVGTSGSLVNTAEVIAADQSDLDSTPNNNLAGEDDQDSVTLSTPIADLSLTKGVSNSRPNVGDEVVFTIVARNAGPDLATGVVVTDLLPAGLTAISSTVNSGDYNSNTGEWTVGDIAVNSTRTLTIRARVDSSQDTINVAQITSADQFDPNSTPGNNIESEDDQAAVMIDPLVADLSLTKSIVGNTRPNIGDPITFRIDVTNNGPDMATNLVVLDQLPAGLTFVSTSSTSFDNTTGRWTIGDLAAGASASLMIVARVDSTSGLANTAQVLSVDQFDPDSVAGNGIESEDDQDSATFTTASADLSLTKTVDNASPNVGQNVVFTVTAANAGPDSATGVTVRDPLPTGLTFVSASESLGNYDSATGLWTVGSIDVGGSATLTLTATTTTPNPTTNTAEVFTADQVDPDSTVGNSAPGEDDFDSVVISGQQIDLSLTKTINDPRPNVGSEVTFQISVRNDGSSPATGVVVADSLPAGITLISSMPSRGSFNTTSRVWTLGSLAVGELATLDLVARIDQILNSATNTAQVTAADQSDSDSAPGNDVASEDDQDSVQFSTPVADLSLIKTLSNNAPNVGDTVTFNIVISNVGPDAATNVVVQDLLPSGLMFQSSSLSTGSYDPESGNWTVGTVTRSETLSILAVVTSQGQKTNTARVTASDQADPDSTAGNDLESEDDQSSVSLAPPVIDLSLTKTASQPRPAVGEIVTFTVTATNVGPSDATGVVVNDKLPVGISFIGSQVSQGSYDPVSGNWTIGSLTAGSSATLDLMTSVSDADAKINSAEVTAADQFDADSTPGNGIPNEDDQANITITPASADLSLTKTIDKATPNVGANVTFTLVLTNAGPDSAAGVTVRDNLPNGTTFVSANPNDGSFDPVNNLWTLPTIAAGATNTLEIVARVETIGDKTNTAEIVSSGQFDPDSTPGNANADEDDQASVSLSPEQVDLALTKTIDDPVPNVGDTIAYLLTLSNAGVSAATGVAVTDPLPAGLTFENSTPSQGTYDATTGIWSVGSVAVGATPTLLIRATVGNTRGETNLAEVTAVDQSDIDSTPGNKIAGEDDQAEVAFTTQVADLSLTKVVDNLTPNQNQTVNFTLTLANAGPENASSIVVRDLLPPGLTFLSASPSSGSYDPTTGLWSLASVPVSTTATLQIAASTTTRLATTNTAEIFSVRQFDPDSTPGNSVSGEDDLATATITPAIVDISVTASVDNEMPLEGDVITLTFNASNAGPATATGLRLTTLLPDGLTILSAQPQSGSYDSTTGLWNVGTLAAGNSTVLTVTARVDTRGLKRVPIEVTAIDQFDIDSTPANNDDSEDDQATLIIRAPRLLTKRLFLSR